MTGTVVAWVRMKSEKNQVQLLVFTRTHTTYTHNTIPTRIAQVITIELSDFRQES